MQHTWYNLQRIGTEFTTMRRAYWCIHGLWGQLFAETTYFHIPTPINTLRRRQNGRIPVSLSLLTFTVSLFQIWFEPHYTVFNMAWMKMQFALYYVHLPFGDTSVNNIIRCIVYCIFTCCGPSISCFHVRADVKSVLSYYVQQSTNNDIHGSNIPQTNKINQLYFC